MRLFKKFGNINIYIVILLKFWKYVKPTYCLKKTVDVVECGGEHHQDK